MNILFQYESLAIGGQQTQTLNILKEIYERGEDNLFFVYNYNDNLASEYENYCTLIKIPATLKTKDYLKPWKLVRLIYKTAQQLKINHIECVVSGSGLGSLICGVAAKLCGAKHYRIIGCSLVQVERTLYRFYKIIGIDRLIDGYFGWELVFNELKKKGVKEKKFIHTTGSVDTNFFYPLPKNEVKELKKRYALPENKLIIGWVGRISYDMQVKYTIELCRVLLEKDFDQFHLLIVGGGNWFEEMKIKLADYKLAPYSTLTNWVMPVEVNGLINVMDIVPLLEEDPQGGSIVREAMACGKIALSVDGVSGTQASFMKPNSSILVNPEYFIDSASVEIVKIYNNPEIIRHLGINARAYAEKELSFASQVDIILRTIKR
jgi:glycosyltransferase involved in cell wall biosynthesis